MITESDILTEINRMLAIKFPQNPVYINLCPKDFRRPSFLIEYVKTTWQDANRSTIEATVFYTVTCFASVDDYYRTDTEALSEIRNTVMDLFRGGYVQVGDRAVKVQASTSGMDFDSAYIDLEFNYYDDRLTEAEEIPLMETIQTKIQEG